MGVSFLKRRVLFKIILMFAIAIIVPAVIIGVLVIRNSNEHILRQVDLSSSNLLTEKKLYMEQMLSEIESVTSQIMASDEYWNLMQPFDDAAKHHEAMYEMLHYISQSEFSHPNLASIYLVNWEEDYVLADAKYSMGQFYDQGAYQGNPPTGISVTPKRMVYTHGYPAVGREQISFIRSVKDFNNGGRVDLMLNMDYAAFSERLQSVRNPYQMDMLVFDDRGQLIFNQTDLEPDAKQLESIRSVEGTSGTIDLDSTSYYVSKTYSAPLHWTIVYMQNYDKLVGTADLLDDMIRSTIVVVAALALVLGIFFAISIYKPLGSLASQVRKQVRGKPGSGHKDEYSFIGDAVELLFHENHALQSRYERAYPYLRQHSIKEMLSGNVWDPERWDSIVELLNVSFEGSRFAAAVLELDHSRLGESTVADVEAYLTQQVPACLLSGMSESRLAIVINADLENEAVRRLFEGLLQELNRRGTEATISVSPTCDALPQLSSAYQEAVRQLNHKFFAGKNRVIAGERRAEDAEGRAVDPDRVQEELLASIRAQQIDRARSVLGSYLSSVSAQALSITSIKYAAFRISSGLRDVMADVGGEPDTALAPERIWDDIYRTETIQELERYMLNFLEISMSEAGRIKQKQHEDLIRKAKAFIETNYREDLSIKDIAVSVYLSPGYLSTIFRAGTGMTVLDYLTQVRMDAALELLKEAEVRIQDVAMAVGYNNSQSFIRFFKKTYQMTPLEYRRSLAPLQN